MKVIDAHVHVFETLKGFGPKGELRGIGAGKARWSNGDVVGMIPTGYGEREFTGESLIQVLNENQVEKAVLLQGSFYGFQNEYTAEVVAQYPERLVGAGTLDPFCLNAPAIYERLVGELGYKIFKFEVSSGGGLMGYHGHFSIAGILDNYARQSEAAGHTFVIDIGSPGMDSFQPEEVRTLALKYPKLKFVVCHLLAPHLTDEKTFIGGLECLTLPNIWFDLAAVPFNLMPEPWPYPTATKYLTHAINLVGHKKLIWGSDIPSVLVHESYENLLNYLDYIPELTEEMLADIRYNNALEAYPFTK